MKIILILLILSVALAVNAECDYTGAIITSECGFNGVEKIEEAIMLVRGWFNKLAVLALIVSGFAWLKGKIHPQYPISVFIAIIVVNSARELVSFFT